MITQESISTLLEMYKQIDILRSEASDIFAVAIVNKDNMIKIDDKTEVSERTIWAELRYTTKDEIKSDRYKEFREKYPKYFELLFAIQDLKDSIIKYEESSLGFSSEEMTMSNIIKLINAVIDMRASGE